MTHASRIFVAGHKGLAGAAITQCLKALGFRHLILRTRQQVDLMSQEDVNRFFASERPEYVFLAAAKVGGIVANATYPVEFLRDNLAIQQNVIGAAHNYGSKKLLFLGSSCVYPRMAPQPIKEEYLLTGELEKTNEAYAIAKIAGIKLCQAYRAQYGFDAISLMPTNLYGPGDNFDLNTSHVIPALIRKCHAAKTGGSASVTIWGTGAPRREFMHADDLASAAVFLMQNYSGDGLVNVGLGSDISIREAAQLVAKCVGFKGSLIFDASKPDGTPRKMLDVTKLHGLGWQHRIPLEEGLKSTYEWFQLSTAEASMSLVGSCS